MIEDIYEPLDTYRNQLKDEHARHTAELFESLVATSGVDEQVNAETVRVLRTLEKSVEDAKTSSGWWKAARIAAVIGGCVGVVLAFSQEIYWWLLLTVAAAVLVIRKLNPAIRDITERLARLEEKRDRQRQQAWQEMAPLNQLYRWEFLSQLIQKTVPRIEFDPYFTDGRLAELRDTFGWHDEFNDDRSVLFAHSGVLNGNPFVVARTLQHWIGEKTYHGTLQISWTERVKDSQGKWTTVTRYQTLHASVTKPYPVYADRPCIIYGNEAAPDLTFSRQPSSLSGLEDGLFNNWRKRRAVKALEAKSRDLKDGKGFTVMANAEFDALFGATDRDHEVQFRLLFTPLAQQEMLKLLKDQAAGFGDNFQFLKQHRLNFVVPGHLAGQDISGNPELFHHYELAQARQTFNDYYNTMFRSLFFSLAPLLSIPLYQQHRSHADIYRDHETRRSNFWEHESIANYFGEHHFQHPDCVTRNILKTQASVDAHGAQVVEVTAHGYRGIERVDYIPVRGGDGHVHNVPVPWIDYHSVRRSSEIYVHEMPPQTAGQSGAENGGDTPNWKPVFQARGLDPEKAHIRRSIVASLLG